MPRSTASDDEYEPSPGRRGGGGDVIQNMPYDEALALRLLSMHSKSSAREAQQAAQEAQEIFKRLGVDPSLV